MPELQVKALVRFEDEERSLFRTLAGGSIYGLTPDENGQAVLNAAAGGEQFDLARLGRLQEVLQAIASYREGLSDPRSLARRCRADTRGRQPAGEGKRAGSGSGWMEAGDRGGAGVRQEGARGGRSRAGRARADERAPGRNGRQPRLARRLYASSSEMAIESVPPREPLPAQGRPAGTACKVAPSASAAEI